LRKIKNRVYKLPFGGKNLNLLHYDFILTARTSGADRLIARCEQFVQPIFANTVRYHHWHPWPGGCMWKQRFAMGYG
jgi:hypothetical protein